MPKEKQFSKLSTNPTFTENKDKNRVKKNAMGEKISFH